MVHRLVGAFKKVERADAHLRRLQEDVEAWINRHPYEVTSEQYAHKREWRRFTAEEVWNYRLHGTQTLKQLGLNEFAFPIYVLYFRVVLRIREEPPLLEWSIRTGEIIHLLRSALDNLVWALTESFSGLVGYPVPKKWRRVQFPVAPSKGDWDGSGGGQCEKNRLSGIDPKLTTRFERLQPFRGRKNCQQHWLWMLNELWNADKHRTTLTTYHLAGLQRTTLAPATTDRSTFEEFRRDVAAKRFKTRHIGPCEGETELGRFRVTFKRPNDVLARLLVQSGMQVDHRLGVDIGFEQGGPGQGRTIIKTLKLFLDRTMAVLSEFEPYCT